MTKELYPFFQWTEEWKVPSNSREAILNASWIRSHANNINDTIDTQKLIKKIIELPEDKKKQKDVLKLDNPRVRAFNSWINWNEENKIWYKNNRDNLKLVQDNWEICVEMRWDIFEPEDEKAQENWEDIWNYEWNTYFTFDSAERIWKRIPDWNKYVDFLPWTTENKVHFLINVLWLIFAGNRNRSNGHYYGKSTDASYWSCRHYSSNSNVLSFSTTSIYQVYLNSRAYGFSVRCLKN